MSPYKGTVPQNNLTPKSGQKHCVKKLDIRADFGYMYSFDWHLITTFQKRLYLWVCIKKFKKLKFDFQKCC